MPEVTIGCVRLIVSILHVEGLTTAASVVFAGVTFGAAILRVGATVQFPPMSFTEEIVVSVTVARAVGLVVQVPQVTVTTGAVV